MARAGDVVGGKYKLIHPLGIGGMGTVWRAEHQALKQQVAIKLLDARGPTAERAVKRFKREAQIAASVRHRNIVYISDFGIDGGAPYLVMELLSGVPLSERMVVGEPLSVGSFLHLIDETLQGLAAVHAAGVVHRDMKPENIFLVRESDTLSFPKLLDFGVSRSTERGQGHTITREGVVMGTPEYVSPEQARGRMADARSDIYSLGVVVYEALAGRLPFQADNPADLIVAVLNMRPLPLSTFRPELGPRISDLVAKAMERDPDRRFQTVDEMRAAIAALLSEVPELAAHSLPRRFLAPPNDYGNDGDYEQTNPSATAPTLSGPTTTATPAVDLPFERLPLPQRSLMRWLGLSAALIAGLSGLFFFGRDTTAGARAARPAITASAPPVVASSIQPVRAAALPSEVVVELFGVPPTAQVRVDGALTSDSRLSFARGSGTHEIVVSELGHESFRVLHDASRDGRYAIALQPEKRAAKTSKPAAPARAPIKRGGLVRTPDF